MPAEYPGLYWDETRNRYFPLSSRPDPKPRSNHRGNGHRVDEHKEKAAKARTNRSQSDRPRRQHVPWHTHLSRMSGRCYTQTMRDSHDILCYHYSNTSACSTEMLPTLSPIQAFSAARMDGETWQFAGDNEGWLYIREPFGRPFRNVHPWYTELILRTSEPISSISTSETHCVVSCLGPGKVSVQSLLSPESLWTLNFTTIHDIWTSSLRGSTLVLGANKQASYLADIDHTLKPEHLPTNSDVFSIAQDNTLVYLGSRSGSIHRFDMRTPKHTNQKLFDNRFGTKPRSSVLHLDVGKEYECFMSHLNGDLAMYDLRFAPSASSSTKPPTPIRVFEGHVNTHTRNLGIALDQEHDILFAAGQDCRIRAWSLRTGIPLSPPSLSPVVHPSSASSIPSKKPIFRRNPLVDTFANPVLALQVSEEDVDVGRGHGGVCLWAASGNQVYRYWLGQHGLSDDESE